MLILDERHQIDVVLTSDDEDALAAVTLGVRVLQDIEQVASLDVEGDFFEPDAALRPELRFFASSQSKYFIVYRILGAVSLGGSVIRCGLGKPPPSVSRPPRAREMISRIRLTENGYGSRLRRPASRGDACTTRSLHGSTRPARALRRRSAATITVPPAVKSRVRLGGSRASWNLATASKK